MAVKGWKREGARLGVLLLFLPLFAGCAGFMAGRPPGPWHEAYEPIEDPASESFLSNAFKRARAEFGDPSIPVEKVLLRRSRRTKAARRYRIGEDFSLTECVDPTNGLFVVYIGVDPDHSNYFALLAHEALHLLNPYITDWYMEGMATVFSEQVCEAEGRPWGDWRRHFARSRREPYALSYRMMLELREQYPAQYPFLLECAVPNDKADGPWLRIDIDRWIGLLPPSRREEARGIIDPYTAVLRKHTGRMYGFTVPETE